MGKINWNYFNNIAVLAMEVGRPGRLGVLQVNLLKFTGFCYLLGLLPRYADGGISNRQISQE
jgi:hypothetical protein